MNRSKPSPSAATSAAISSSNGYPSSIQDELNRYLSAAGIQQLPLSRHVKMVYRYCCSSGQEYQSETVLTNAYAVTVSQLCSLLKVLCFDGLYFDAVRCGLPCLAPDIPDPDWHEVLHVVSTDAPCTIALDVTDFLTNALKQQRPRSFASRFLPEPQVN